MKIEIEIMKKCHVLKFELNKTLNELSSFIVDERMAVAYESLIKTIEVVVDALEKLIEEDKK